MKYGDICLVQYPFTDGSSTKLRPVLVVSCNTFHAGEDIVVLPMTSNLSQPEENCVVIDELSPHWNLSGLKYASAIKCTKPMALSKKVIERRLGKAHDEIMREARTILAKLLSITSQDLS